MDKIDNSFDLVRETAYEEMLKRIVLEACNGFSCEVFLFGSRANGSAGRSSDFDVGIIGLSAEEFLRVKRLVEEAVEEGPIPHDVDIVNFDRALESFKRVALKERILWKSA